MGLRDDELWDDLKYWLSNPITEEEQKARDKEINDYVKFVVEKMFKD